MNSMVVQDTPRLHQILVADGYGLPATLPPIIAQNTAALRALYPDAEYRLWDGNALRAMIAENFEPEVLAAFDLLGPYAYKSDLARFCLLYLYGGLYVDLGIRFMNPLRPPMGVGLASFKDNDFMSPSWTAVALGLTWAVPGRREMRIAIDYVLENCRTKYYGSSPLYPTGPVLFGRALIAAMAEKRQGEDADDQWIGVSRAVTPGKPQENITYVAPDHTLVAMRVKLMGGDLLHLGARGTNNYNSFWHLRRVYGGTSRSWEFDDPDIRLTEKAVRTSTGIAAVSDREGFLTYGPYIELEPGAYRLTLAFDDGAQLPRVILDVPCNSGQRMLATSEVEGGPGAPTSIALEFDLADTVTSVEFRTQVFGLLQGEIRRFTIERLGPPRDSPALTSTSP